MKFVHSIAFYESPNACIEDGDKECEKEEEYTKQFAIAMAKISRSWSGILGDLMEGIKGWFEQNLLLG